MTTDTRAGGGDTDIRVGSLCTGYGGLDMAATTVFGGHLAWVSEIDPHASQILTQAHPHVPNLGDLTRIDFRQLNKVDVLCAGFPCQDISTAGNGAGIREGTRSGLWITIAEGIRHLRPGVVFVENVSALRGRGLDRVLGDLATHGYDTCWTCLRAADVGAPHRRERMFILAHRPEARPLLDAAAHPHHEGCRWNPGVDPEGAPPSGRGQRCGYHAVAAARPHQRHPAGGHQPHRCSYTPSPARDHRCAVGGSHHNTHTRWGAYEPAIRRWETLTSRAAPHPTERGRHGQPRIAPRFTEWMMGLPAGLVTDTGLPHTAQCRAVGNGVVPQQATAALAQLVQTATTHTPARRRRKHRTCSSGSRTPTRT